MYKTLTRTALLALLVAGLFGILAEKVASPVAAGTGSSCPGPDGFGYRCFSVARQYIYADTPLPFSTSCSIGGSPPSSMALPFTFNFYGVDRTTFTATCWGNIQFNTSSNYSGTDFPNNQMGATIAALMGSIPGDNGFPNAPGSFGSFFTYAFTTTVGQAPNRTFVVEWRKTNFGFPGDAAPPSYFEIQLEETTNNVFFVYGTTSKNGAIGDFVTAGIQQGAVSPNDNYLVFRDHASDPPFFTAACFSTAQSCPSTLPAPPPTLKTQICFQVDGSNSISANDFALIKSGLAAAIQNASAIPQDSTVEVTVVQFSTWGQVEVLPMLIDSANTAASVAAGVLAMTQIAGGTSYRNATGFCNQYVVESMRFPVAARQVFNIATDGEPTSFADLERSQSLALGIDENDAEALGAGIQPGSSGFTFLRDSWVYPQPGKQAPPFTGPGFVIPVSNLADIQSALIQKLQQVVSGGPGGGSPTPTPTPTATPTPGPSATPTRTSTPGPLGASTATPTATVSPTPTATVVSALVSDANRRLIYQIPPAPDGSGSGSLGAVVGAIGRATPVVAPVIAAVPVQPIIRPPATGDGGLKPAE